MTKEYVLEKLRAGKISNMSEALPLSEKRIMESTAIVSQIGIGPIMEMLRQGAGVSPEKAVRCDRTAETPTDFPPALYSTVTTDAAY